MTGLILPEADASGGCAGSGRKVGRQLDEQRVVGAYRGRRLRAGRLAARAQAAAWHKISAGGRPVLCSPSDGQSAAPVLPESLSLPERVLKLSCTLDGCRLEGLEAVQAGL